MRRLCRSAKWVNDLDEREAVKIGISGIYPADAVFSHDNGRMRIVEKAPSNILYLLQC